MTKSKIRKPVQQSKPDDFGIATYIYPPEELKRIVPEFAEGSLPEAPVAAHGDCINYAPVISLHFSFDEQWQKIIEYALKDNSKIHKNTNDTEEHELKILIQTIVEHGQKMLPLLQSLKEKSHNNKKLANLVSILQSRLNTGINAACLLAPRELEVLELATHGATNSEIAQKLQLKTVTVAKALSRTYFKLDAKNRSEAIHKWAIIRNIKD